jgi:hypothetical protein
MTSQVELLEETSNEIGWIYKMKAGKITGEILIGKTGVKWAMRLNESGCTWRSSSWVSNDWQTLENAVKGPELKEMVRFIRTKFQE